MEASDKNWAQSYLIDPLTAPQPADETGPGTHFRAEPESKTSSLLSTPPRTPTSSLSSNNPYRKHGSPKQTSATTTEVKRSSYPSPPASRSPRGSPSHRQEAFTSESGRPRRSSSLRERYPGDKSVRPLEQLTKEKAKADKSRHVTKKHHVNPDSIDGLDQSSPGRYHHGGPYDATLFARNNSYNSSPVAAVTSTNKEALKATPKERVVDSVERHRPLDGVASYAPGEMDRNGHIYNYEQGENMMTDLNPEGGAYKRWAGMQYHPEDYKGKGEPSYSIEKALKEHSLEEKERRHGDGTEGFEMVDTKALKSEAFADDEGQLGRSGNFGHKLKKRVGSLKKKMHHED